MTPAEKLRAAAAKLREQSKGTTPGPWIVLDWERYPRWIRNEDANGNTADVARSYTDGGGDGLDVSDADWQWMAFAHPGLAEPLAFLLEEAAKQADMNVTRAPRHRVDVTAALAVARAINGSGS